MPFFVERFTTNFAAALLSGEWIQSTVLKRARFASPKHSRWVKPLVARIIASFPELPTPRPLLAFLNADDTLSEIILITRPKPQKYFFLPERMEPSTVPLLGERPGLPTLSSLAAWLKLTPSQLDWYADRRGLNSIPRAERSRLYRYRWLAKPGPNPIKKFRLLEVPLDGLMRVQRKINRELLNLIPPHAAAHGFRAKHSILTNAQPHCGQRVVLKFDLKDFFPSVSAAKMRAVFGALGYPKQVVDAFTGLCTSRLPDSEWEARPNPSSEGSDHFTGVRLRQRHLPQGAPTSPALANLCAYGLDVRLAALASELDAQYTRYADDLTISGNEELSRSAVKIQHLVTRIAAAEGFAVNALKSRIQRQSQRQMVAGVIVNVRPNSTRADFDELKAILTNCANFGPSDQNRAGVPDFRVHLAGRISHLAALNPIRGRKLWAIFDRIEWG